jgi:hypothetical protein
MNSATVKSSKSLLPKVQEFDSSSATVDDAVKAMKIAGGVIVRNLLDMEQVNQITKDVIPYLEADRRWYVVHVWQPDLANTNEFVRG